MSNDQITVITEISQAQVSETDNSISVTVTDSPVSVTETVHSVTVLEASNEISIAYGSPGAQGAPGTGAGGTVEAGENIPGHRVIVILNDLAFLADPTNLSHGLATLGIVRDAVSAGATITYYLAGEVNGGSFIANSNYFVGLGGVLSVNPVASGAVWMKRIGTAISSSVLVIDPDPVILL